MLARFYYRFRKPLHSTPSIMNTLPVTVKRSIELLGIFLIGYLIFVGSEIIAPLLMAFFISIVLLPVYRFFMRIRFPELLSIFMAILLLLVLIVGIFWFFSSQISRLVS